MAQRVKTDWILFWAVTGTLVAGLVMVYSASSIMAQEKYGSSFYFVVRQGAWALVAFLLMMLIRRLDYRKLNCAAGAFAPLLAVLPLLIAVYFLDGRAHRWLHLGPVHLQPSEFAKPALILFLACFVTRRANDINKKRNLIGGALIVGVVSALVVIADLGTAAVMVVTAAVVFWVAGLDWKYVRLAIAASVLVLLAAIAYKPYRVVRIIGFFDPTYATLEKLPFGNHVRQYIKQASYSADPAYHVRQSKIAVGSGGVEGEGLMQSKQKLLYLPEAHTDFIYAVVGEELGLWGSTLLVSVFLLILWRGFKLVRGAPDEFGRYLALGVTTMLVVQAFINMSVVLGLAPTKGIPLPLISYGGSSLLSTLMSMGLLMSVSEQSG